LREPKRICFVCLGNIVRSPLAENLFRHLAQQAGASNKYEVESAGIGPWHVGEPPDPRMLRVAKQHGLIYDGRGRQFKRDDFNRLEMVIAMDREIAADLSAMASSQEHRAMIHTLREFDPQGGPRLSVPDPYYGGIEGFEQVYQIVERSTRGLLQALENDHFNKALE
jgi:protein-tyrosine phosphatase